MTGKQNYFQMKLSLEDELKQWVCESQSAVAAKLRPLLLADSDITYFLKCLASLNEADKQQLKQINYSFRYQIFSKIEARVKAKDLLDSYTKSFIRDLISVTILLDQRISKLLFVLEKIVDPNLFLFFIEEIIEKAKKYELHEGTQGLTSEGNMLIEALKKQVEVVQNIQHKQAYSIQLHRVVDCKENLIEFELAISSLIQRLLKDAKVESSCDTDWAFYLAYINETKKYELLRYLFMIDEEGIHRIQLSLAWSKMKIVGKDRVILENNCKELDVKLINGEVLSYLQRGTLKKHALRKSFWQTSNFCNFQNSLFLKYIPQNCEAMTPLKEADDIELEGLSEDAALENFKETIQRRLQCAIQVLQAIASDKKILVYETIDTWRTVNRYERLSLVRIILNAIHECGKESIKKRIKYFFSKSLRSPQFVHMFACVLQDMLGWEQKLISDFAIAIQILDCIIFEGTIDVYILNNKLFLDVLGRFIHKYFDYKEFIPISNFIGLYLSKLIQFGLDERLVSIEKFHLLKFQQAVELKRQKYHRDDQRDYFFQYLCSFPECYEVFAFEAKSAIDAIRLEHQNITTFYYPQNNAFKVRQKFEKIINLVSKYSIVVNEELKESIRELLRKCGFCMYRHSRYSIYKGMSGMNGINIKEEIDRCLQKYQKILNINLLLTVPPIDFVKNDEPVHECLQQFAKISGEINSYIQIANELHLNVPMDHPLMLRVFFRIEEVRMELIDAIANSFIRNRDQISTYMKSSRNSLKKCLYQQLKESYMKPIEEYIINYIIKLPAQQKIGLLTQYSKYLEKQYAISQIYLSFAFSKQILKLQVALSKGVNVCFSNMQINKEPILKMLHSIYFTCNQQTKSDIFNDQSIRNIFELIQHLKLERNGLEDRYQQILKGSFFTFLIEMLVPAFFGFAFTQQSLYMEFTLNDKLYKGEENTKKMKNFGDIFILNIIVDFMSNCEANIQMGMLLAENVIVSSHCQQKQKKWFEVMLQTDIQVAVQLPEGLKYDSVVIYENTEQMEQQMQELAQYFCHMRHRFHRSIQINQKLAKRIKSVDRIKRIYFKSIAKIFEETVHVLQQKPISIADLDRNLKEIKQLKQPQIKEILSFSHLLSQQFINIFVASIKQLISPPSLKEISSQVNSSFFNNISFLIQKIVPNKFSLNSRQQEICIQTLLFIIINLMQLNKENIEISTLESLVLKFVNNNYECWPIMEFFFEQSLQTRDYQKLINIIHKLVEKEMIEKMEMEAHLKAHFLKIEQNATNDTHFLASPFPQFVNSFKLRFNDNIEEFTGLARVFVRKVQQVFSFSISKANISFVLSRKHKLWYSQLAKMEFIKYEPGKYVLLAFKIIRDQIKRLLEFESGKLQYEFVFAIGELIHAHPLVLPSFLLQHTAEEESILDILLGLIAKESNSQRYLIIINFIVSLALDHSVMIKLKDKTIFFSEYLSFIIIKKIAQKKLCTHMLALILSMVRLKRFNLMCTVKINREIDSLRTLLERHLFFLNSLEDTNRQKVNNQIVCEILFYIYKYEEIHNLRRLYAPVSKEYDDCFLVNQCLIPFEAIYFDNDESIIAKRFQVIKPLHRGLKCDPLHFNTEPLSEIYQEISHLEDQTVNVQKKKPFRKNSLGQQSFKVTSEFLKMLQSKCYEESEFPRHYNGQYFTEKTGVFNKRLIDLISAIDPPQQYEYDLRSTIQEHEKKIIQKRCAVVHQNKGQSHETSRYAPEEFFFEEKTKEKILHDNRMVELLKMIPEIQAEQDLNSMQHSREMARAKLKLDSMDKQEMDALIDQINAFRMKVAEEPPLTAECIEGIKGVTQKREYLLRVLAEVQFRYRYENLQQNIENIINDFRSSNRLHFLQKYAEFIEPYELKYETSLLYRRFSTESIDSNISRQTNIIIDNFILRSSKKVFDIQSLYEASERSFDEINQIDDLDYDFGPMMHLGQEFFPKLSEELAFQFITMLYQCCDTTGPFERVKKNISQLLVVPILENKHLQDKIINTLIYILRDPTSNKLFPHFVNQWRPSEKKWVQLEKVDSDRLVRARIFQILDWVRHFCFYHNPEFLKNQIGYEAICGLKLEHVPQYEQSFTEDTHAPYVEIIDLALDFGHYLAASLLKNTNSLPKVILRKIIDAIKEPIWKQSGYRLRADRRSLHILNSLGNLSENQLFKSMYFQQFPLGKKHPKYEVLSELVVTNLYSKEYLMGYHIQILKKCKQKNAGTHEEFGFLNKIYQIYTDEDLQSSVQLPNFQDVHCQILNQMNASKCIIEKQPIIKILKHPRLLNFTMKQNFFYNSINSNRQSENWREEAEIIKSERSIGIFYSAFKQLRNKPNQFWRDTFKIKFYDQQNQAEQSGGLGIQRQWYSNVTKQMMLEEEGLFELTPGNVYFFSKNCMANPLHLQYFQFIGKMVGLSFTNSTFYITPTLSKIVYKLLLEEKIDLDDVSEHYDGMKFKEQKQHLQKMKLIQDADFLQGFTFTWERKKLISARQFHEGHYLPNEEKVIEHFKQSDPNNPGQYFSRNEHKVKDLIELKPNGTQIPLTLNNIHEYVQLRKKQCINCILDGLEKPIEAFKAGVSCVIDLKKLKIFNCDELRRVVEGDYTIDMDQFRKGVAFTVDNPQNPMRQWFYQCVEGLNHKQRSVLLQFWNASPKMNPDGIAATGLKVLIEDSRKNDLLPRSQTCSHLLIIPTYSSKAILKARLNKVIEQFSRGQLRQYD